MSASRAPAAGGEIAAAGRADLGFRYVDEEIIVLEGEADVAPANRHGGDRQPLCRGCSTRFRELAPSGDVFKPSPEAAIYTCPARGLAAGRQ